jgi:uncharacterized membrane protein YczE
MVSLQLDNKDPYAYLQVMVGFVVIALGIVSMFKANFGMNPWGVFHVGVTNHIPLTLGRASQLVGLAIIGVSFFLGIRPGIGTVLNMFFIGLFIDLINPYVPSAGGYLAQIFMLVAGVAFVGIGSGLYMNANLGAGPRDGLMLGLSTRMGMSIRIIRNIIELFVLTAGFFLGGPAGVGRSSLHFLLAHLSSFSLK